MTQIFPTVQPEATEKRAAELPLCRECAWDYENGVPLFESGQPVIVTGLEAVKVWCWRALHTERFRHEIYTWDYGCELTALIGRAFTDDVKESEATRYVKETLMVNPYIKAVQQISVSFSGEFLAVQCLVSTIYGEVSVHV